MERLIDDRISKFRKENPNHIIITNLEHFDENTAVVSAVIQDENGNTIQTAHGHCDKSEDEYGTYYVATAESMAISRAVRFFYGSDLSPLETALGERIKGKLASKRGKDAVDETLNKLKSK